MRPQRRCHKVVPAPQALLAKPDKPETMQQNHTACTQLLHDVSTQQVSRFSAEYAIPSDVTHGRHSAATCCQTCSSTHATSKSAYTEAGWLNPKLAQQHQKASMELQTNRTLKETALDLAVNDAHKSAIQYRQHTVSPAYRITSVQYQQHMVSWRCCMADLCASLNAKSRPLSYQSPVVFCYIL